MATIVVTGVIIIAIGTVAEAIKHVEEIFPSSPAPATPGSDRQLRGFLCAKQLAVPGATYTDGELILT